MSTVNHNKSRYALSSLVNTTTNFTTSWQQIAGGSIDFECGGDRPVWFKLIKDGTNPAYLTIRLNFGKTAYAYTEYGFRLKIDGTVVAETTIGDVLGVSLTSHFKDYPFDIVNFITFPTAGTHTFSLEIIATNIPSGDTPAFYVGGGSNGYKLLVMEM